MLFYCEMKYFSPLVPNKNTSIIDCCQKENVYVYLILFIAGFVNASC